MNGRMNGCVGLTAVPNQQVIVWGISSRPPRPNDISDRGLRRVFPSRRDLVETLPRRLARCPRTAGRQPGVPHYSCVERSSR